MTGLGLAMTAIWGHGQGNAIKESPQSPLMAKTRYPRAIWARLMLSLAIGPLENKQSRAGRFGGVYATARSSPVRIELLPNAGP